MIPLKTILKAGYSNNKKEQRKELKPYHYKLDKQLTNNNHQVYYNKKTNNLLYNSNGTQKSQFFTDWADNGKIALGLGTQSTRYKEEQKNLNLAKAKYGNPTTTITGHSKGGYYAQKIADTDDKVITYNSATLPFQNTHKNSTNYRTTYDPISGFSSLNKNTITLPTVPSNYIFTSSLNTIKDAHDLSNLSNNVKV